MTAAEKIAELITIISNAEKMLSGIYKEIELPGEWENGVSDCIDEMRESLANNQNP